jgi:hypothetical protein
VRAHGHAGAPLRHLDLEVLREALSRPRGQEWEDASLIVQLIVEGIEPALVAAKRDVSPPPQVHPGDMGRPRRGRHRRARHRHNGKRMSDGKARLRDELAMLEAQADLARGPTQGGRDRAHLRVAARRRQHGRGHRAAQPAGGLPGHGPQAEGLQMGELVCVVGNPACVDNVDAVLRTTTIR